MIGAPNLTIQLSARQIDSDPISDANRIGRAHDMAMRVPCDSIPAFQRL
jgi:hypothetical protein